jgi:iron(III) transport system permease protein
MVDGITTLAPPPPDLRAERLRRGPKRAPALIWLPALLVGVAMLTVPAYLLVSSLFAGGEAWRVLVETDTLRLMARTLGLAAAVTVTAVVLGVGLAFLTARTDLPVRRLIGVASVIPLVIPSFLGAFAIVAALAPGGLLTEWFAALGIDGVDLPSPYGFGGAYAALTLFTYPYVLLTVRGALRGIDPALEEASRTLGRGGWATFRTVTLPQLRPAIGAGGLLVTLYVLSDFGAVTLMRYSTLTQAIYVRYLSSFDRGAAGVLALLLVAMTVGVLVAESRASRAQAAQFRRAHGSVPGKARVVPLRRWRWPAAAACLGVVGLALVVPLTVIGYWLVRGLAAGEPVALTLGATGRTVQAAALATLACVVAALPVAMWSVRYPSALSRLTERATYAGHALPGIVVALALVFLGIRVVPALYQTRAMLVAAYVVLFLPLAVGAIRAALLQVPPSVEEAARTLGHSRLSVLTRVVLPIARRGAVGGGALVFLTVVKELPATLLLAPTGFDTLATRVWSATNQAFFAQAAVPALTLLVLASLPLAVLVNREQRR